jgi:hypothetical protein
MSTGSWTADAILNLDPSVRLSYYQIRETATPAGLVVTHLTDTIQKLLHAGLLQVAERGRNSRLWAFQLVDWPTNPPQQQSRSTLAGSTGFVGPSHARRDCSREPLGEQRITKRSA